MSQDPKVVSLEAKKKQKKNDLSDKEKLVFAYHYFESGDEAAGKTLLTTINPQYFMIQLHKDVSRALLCYLTYKQTNDPALGKESEFYLVLYKLTKIVVKNKLIFKNSGYFHELVTTLFKGFNL